MADSSQPYARPLIPLLLALMAGMVVAFHVPNFSGVFLAILLFFFFLLLFVRKGQKAQLLPIFLFFALGYWSLQSWISPRLPANHISHFVDGGRWHIIGTIDGAPQQFPERTRFILNAESLARKGLFHKVKGAVQVTTWEPVTGLRSGDRVACIASLKEIRNFNNPGGFDYCRYLAFRGIRASASVSKARFVIRLHSAKAWWYSIDRSRSRVSRLIERAIAADVTHQEASNTAERRHPAISSGENDTAAEGRCQFAPCGSRFTPQGGGPCKGRRVGTRNEVQGVLKALLVGDRSEISPKMRDAFGRIGTAHLLAISGLHIGIVASLAFFCFRFILSRSERVLLAGWATKGAALLSLFPVLFYGFLAGMSSATKRAVIMVAVYLLALLFERERDTINTLAVAALLILIVSPTALFAISFQLSFAAVFAILYMIEHVDLVGELRQGQTTLIKRLALFSLVSAAAILGTVPITLYYFNQISLIGLLTNCFMVPLIGFLVVPLGLLAVLFLPASPTLALWAMKGATVILQGSLYLAISFSRWPFAAIRAFTPSFVEIGAYYALAWTLLHFRRTVRAKLVLIGLTLVVVADMGYWVSQRYGRRELRMTVMDVGQGSSALIELPGGECVLADGGGFYGNRFDVGARVVGPFLWKKKITNVDILVLSHPDPDHLNGLLFIARHFHVREVWMNLEAADTQPYRDFLDIISEKGIRVVGPQGLLRARVINGVRFEVLYPPVDFLKRKVKEAWRTPNNNSLVLKVTFRNVSFLLPGDIEAEAERELARHACPTLKSDLVLAPHHGSKSSSTPEFLECVKPEVAVVSSGWKNRFGFPHPKILKRYRALGCQVFRTDHQGAITITTDGEDLTVGPFISDYN
jgi:competence protein ComEC